MMAHLWLTETGEDGLNILHVQELVELEFRNEQGSATNPGIWDFPQFKYPKVIFEWVFDLKCEGRF